VAQPGTFRSHVMRMIPVRVKIEPETDVQIRKWAEQEGRSKTRHVSILMRRLAALRETNPADLERLGFFDAKGVRA
jgi:hypothetical protein